MKQSWIFKVDSSPSVGAGHMMRCLSLAKAMQKKAEITFVLSADDYRWPKYLKELGFKCQKSFPKTEEIFFGVLVDGYRFDEAELAVLKSRCKRTVYFFDPATRREDFDILLCLGIPENCAPKPVKGQLILAGPKYALIDEQYRKLGKTSVEENEKNSSDYVLICCGNVDAKNLNVLALRGLERANYIGQIYLAMSSLSPNLAQLNDFLLSTCLNAELKIDLIGIQDLVANSNFVIGTGGVGLMERMSLGKPSITFVASENQELISNWADINRCTYTLDPSNPDFELRLDQAINTLLFDKNKTLDMGVAAKRAVDGKGVMRVVQSITEEQ